MKGERKLRHSMWMALVLLIGFVWASYTKVDPALFTAFVSAISVQSGAFMWGNVKVHEATAKVEVEEARTDALTTLTEGGKDGTRKG
jgi:hypothetical protein